MQFRRLFIRNFLSVGNTPVEIIFPETNGITLVTGVNLDTGSANDQLPLFAQDGNSNGSGKSLIIEALLFALYGKTLRKIKKDEHYINRKAEGDCIVELEFDNAKIIRKFTLNKKGKKKDGEVEFYLNGERQGSDASVTHTKELIQNYIQVTFDAMCNILVFGQHNILSFPEATEPEKREIVENLMNLREYNLYEEKAKKATKELESKIKLLAESHSVETAHFTKQSALKDEQAKKLSQYQSELDRDILSIQLKLDNLPDARSIQSEWTRYNKAEERRKEINDAINTLNAQKNAIIAEFNELTSKKAKESQDKQPLIVEYNNILSQQPILDKQKREKEESIIGPLLTDKEQINQEISTFKDSHNKAIREIVPKENWDALISSAEKLLNETKQSVNNLKNKKLVHDEICTECFGRVDINNCQGVLAKKEKELADRQDTYNKLLQDKKDDSEKIAERIAETTKNYELFKALFIDKLQRASDAILKAQQEIEDSYQNDCKNLKDSLQAVSARIDSFDELLAAKYKDKFSNLETQRNSLETEIVNYNDELRGLGTAVKPKMALDELATVLANAENEKRILAQKEKERLENPFTAIVASLNETCVEIDTRIKKIESDIKELEKLVLYYKFWVHGFGPEGIKSYVIGQIIPSLNEQIEYWMQFLYNGAISVVFDKYLDITITNNASQNEMIFGQGSGGERRRIDIAIMLAFRQVMKLSTGKDPNILYLDEIGENLDSQGILKLYNTIVDIAKHSRVFVITHHPDLLELLKNADKLKVIKEGGITRLAA